MRDVVSVNDPCIHCGGKWEVVPLTIEQRMRKRIGRHWWVRCSKCRRATIAKTFKQERQEKEA